MVCSVFRTQLRWVAREVFLLLLLHHLTKMPDRSPRLNSNSQRQIWFPLLLSVALVLGILLGLRLAPRVAGVAPRIGSVNGSSGKVEELLRYVENKYVDEVDRDELVDKAIESILEELDPHSTYISAADFEATDESMRGNFEGIGVEFMVLDDTVVIVSPLPGGPSDQAGILPGDRIVTVEDSLLAGVNIQNDDITRHLKGPKGSKVRIGIRRNDAADLQQFTITRDRIPVKSVDAGYMLEDGIGYIKINRFSATTHEEFMEELRDLVENRGMKDLIIDLRYNPGGYLQEATRMLNQLFDERDRLLVYTEGRTVGRSEYETNGHNGLAVDDIAVLINEGSASASEIMAGAIQDWDRGVIVGRRSFGKGLVQEQYNLRDGSALRLTVAHYFTPSGRSIQRPYEDRDAYEDDLNQRFQSGELVGTDTLRGDSSALDDEFFTAGNRTVYGGGGITPDVFVPVDSLELDPDFLSVRQGINEFVFRYAAREQPELDAYADLNQFRREFRITDTLLKRYLTFVDSKGYTYDEGRLDEFRPLLVRELKARIARQRFGEEAFYVILNESDEVVREAARLLRNEVPLSAMKRE